MIPPALPLRNFSENSSVLLCVPFPREEEEGMISWRNSVFEELEYYTSWWWWLWWKRGCPVRDVRYQTGPHLLSAPPYKWLWYPDHHHHHQCLDPVELGQLKTFLLNQADKILQYPSFLQSTPARSGQRLRLPSLCIMGNPGISFVHIHRPTLSL